MLREARWPRVLSRRCARSRGHATRGACAGGAELACVTSKLQHASTKLSSDFTVALLWCRTEKGAGAGNRKLRHSLRGAFSHGLLVPYSEFYLCHRLFLLTLRALRGPSIIVISWWPQHFAAAPAQNSRSTTSRGRTAATVGAQMSGKKNSLTTCDAKREYVAPKDRYGPSPKANPKFKKSAANKEISFFRELQAS